VQGNNKKIYFKLQTLKLFKIPGHYSSITITTHNYSVSVIILMQYLANYEQDTYISRVCIQSKCNWSKI